MHEQLPLLLLFWEEGVTMVSLTRGVIEVWLSGARFETKYGNINNLH